MSEPDNEVTGAGWAAISEALRKIYGDVEPLHYGTIVSYRLGGPDPLDGISIYRSEEPVPHWHFVTYGFSDLYGEGGERSGEGDVSGFGFELSFRLAREAGEEGPPPWALDFLQNLARYVFDSGRPFDAGHHMDLNGPIALGKETQIRAIAFRVDPVLGIIATPHGAVTFLQVTGITADELRAKKMWQGAAFLEILETHVPGLITDLGRGSILKLPGVAEHIRARTRAEGSATGLLYLEAVRWKESGGWLRKKELTITLGANAARDFGSYLAGRIPFGQSLVIGGGDKPLAFLPGESVSWEETQEALKIFLPAAAAREMETAVPPRAGTYRLAAAPGLVFEIVKSYIRDQDGNVVEPAERKRGSLPTAAPTV